MDEPHVVGAEERQQVEDAVALVVLGGGWLQVGLGLQEPFPQFGEGQPTSPAPSKVGAGVTAPGVSDTAGSRGAMPSSSHSPAGLGSRA